MRWGCSCERMDVHTGVQLDSLFPVGLLNVNLGRVGRYAEGIVVGRLFDHGGMWVEG